jgi:hypothetical protein
MSRVLLTWELGGGLGHLMNLRPIAAGLLQRGHTVMLAAKDLSRVKRVFDCERIQLFAAPRDIRGGLVSHPIVTYADLLLTVGFADIDSLTAHVQAWQSLYDVCKPDLLICDHSPTALLAARGFPFRIATVGTGFFCPPDESPLRLLRKLRGDAQHAGVDDAPDDLSVVRQREQRLLDLLNQVVQQSSFSQVQSLERMTQLYHNAQVTHFLLTFRELDHFAGRTDGVYRGAWPYGMGGESFTRSSNSDPCLFGYLKPFPALPDVLAALSKAPINSLIYLDALESDKAKYRSRRLQFANGPVDIHQAAQGCDFALTNANHGTCVAMLLAGKPLVLVPPFLEQALLAAAIDRTGASATAYKTNAPEILRAIETVLSNRRFATAAADFATRYRGFRADESCELLLDDVERLLER